VGAGKGWWLLSASAFFFRMVEAATRALDSRAGAMVFAVEVGEVAWCWLCRLINVCSE